MGYFVSQCVHQIMFDTLQKCYDVTNRYRADLFAHIGDTVNMPVAIASALKLDIENSDDAEAIAAEQTKLLSNIFGAYFKNNFKFVLERRLERTESAKVAQSVESTDETELENDEKSSEVVKGDSELSLVVEVLQWTRKEFSRFLDGMGDEEVTAMQAY